jgi:uncharacterized protein
VIAAYNQVSQRTHTSMIAPVQTKADLVAAVQRHAQRIRALGVARLGLFGSFARDEQQPASDVDVLVQFRPEEKTFDHFCALGELLEDVLGRRVELVTPESLSPYIGPKILAEVEYVPLDD